VKVGGVDRGSAHTDKDLAFAGLRSRPRLETEHVGGLTDALGHERSDGVGHRWFLGVAGMTWLQRRLGHANLIGDQNTRRDERGLGPTRDVQRTALGVPVSRR
jgi:hypothetical protein